MLSFPNAKINIGLYITSRRPDGFHNLESCFFPVPWTDGLEVIEDSQTQFTSSGLAIPGDPEQNLCLKAYRLMEQRFSLPPVHIHLHKVLPTGAGLGGGSADAAYTIKLLDQLFDLGLTAESKQDLARELGSDCAFFIENKPVFAYEKGDRFQPLPVDLSGYFLVIVHPGVHISTAEAYSRIKPAPAPEGWQLELKKSPESWRETIRNDFEDALFPSYPVLPELKELLYKSGAVYASMSGSGSAVFGIFKAQTDMKPKLPAGYSVWQGFL